VPIQTFAIAASASDARIYNSAGAPWATVRNAAAGTGLTDTDQSQTQYYLTAGFTTTGTPPYYAYAVYRNFYDFDLSLIPSAGGVRQLISAKVMLGGISYQDSSVILQAASGAGIPFTVNDYNNFTGSPLCSAQTWLSNGSYGLANYLQMNSIGLNYVASKMVSGDQIRFCAREYDHDYLNVDPQGGGGSTQWFKNGGYYANRIGGGDINTDQNMYAPKLIVTYLKSTGRVWKSRMGPSYWTINSQGGTWDGEKYESYWQPSSKIISLDATGSWFTSGGGNWEAGIESFANIVRFTFDASTTINADMRNSDGDENILQYPERDAISNQQKITIYNYNNLAFNDGSTSPFYTLKFDNNLTYETWHLTNIEFLMP
jgi:hypothetical protein